MARKTGLFEDLVEIAAHLPWWISVICAGAAYLAIHPFAVMDVAVPLDAGEIGQGIRAQFGQTLAIFGQYLVPAAFLVGSVVSALRARKREKIFRSVANPPGKSALQGIDWRQFELLVGQWFRKQGYAVTETGGTADGGVDLVLTRDGETSLVQCKHWKAFKIGVNIVRELLGVMAAQGAAAGYIVTSGRFTEEARRFATDCNITLIDGARLSDILSEARSRTPVHQRKSDAGAGAQPTCPKCGSSMVIRKATKGSMIGHPFLGCSRFPSCRGTRPVL